MSDAFDVPTEIADVTIVGPLPLPVTGTITTSPDVNIHASNADPLTATGTSLDVNVTNFPATQAVTQSTTPWIVDGSGFIQPVSGPLTNAELRAAPVPVTIPTPVPVTQQFPAQDILTNQTLTTSGSVALDDVFQLAHEITVVVTIFGPVTGTLPTLQFTLWNLDQIGDVFDPAMSIVYSTAIVPNIFKFVVRSPHLQLNWDITGTLPSFGGVYVSAIGFQSFEVQEVDGTVNVGNFPATQPVSGTVTANQGTPAITVNAWPIKLTDGTDTADITAANALKVDGSAVTQPISAVSLPLPTGAATAANQVTGNASLASIDAGIPAALGQTTMAASMPVVIASNQTAVPVSGTVAVTGPIGVTQSTSPWVVSGTVTANLGTIDGAATEATLGTLLTTSAFQARINTLGQKTMANSTPVVIASDQSTIPVSGPLTDTQLRATPVPVSGTVTANAGTNLNTSALLLDATFTGRVNTQGQKTMAASTPIVIASDQSTLNVAELSTSSFANGTETAVAGTAVQVLAANANRRSATVQNTGAANVRVGITGVTATTGIRLVPGGSITFKMPRIETSAIFAIRETATSSTVFAQESV